ncbi:MAG: iron-sulfur cluster insertion protein ErpA [Gemmatimonadetes bacterium]|uniref:Iron-sulfur cluster insertion protein ErpA n=1 Tax=Candidatus Kutchimonas denitrificans TaxID=3056748 RepID=A0AAE5CBG0_9BACT|nr:iron-sulfur cluster insertion protein ErpA [Gemmatimonadota bacterium]NIR74370.1 iron-sulfur cluster insertion protein ErpA [Candidatus Kutchimonas denitrificans]NIS02621.1 iron-sulfur cluster insertion protein ErpA [Gemmatimonadota bacterium]NIT68496.1 iron-sulfur cluster insertion protein ErpA [Gemmatimonadota bacterium]NIU51973.1 iron-sulfur cluster insertion protein ErpA [Gemmatimonadota bacterium]
METVTTIVLTPEAAEKARQFIAEERLSLDAAGLRVSVLPGGCSGFQYGLNLEEQAREDDEIFESEGIRLFVDPFSMQYLKGTQIGYHSSFQGSGFTFSNPNASGGCGCGSSFAV